LVNTAYFVVGTLGDCNDSDTTFVTVKPKPFAYVTPQDTTICRGSTVNLAAFSSISGSQFSWSNGLAVPFIAVTPQLTTLYHIIVTADNCKDTADARIEVIEAPEIYLGDDDFLCDGNNVSLSVPEGYTSYFWSNGSDQTSIVVSSSGIYWVVVKEQFCETTDTIVFKNCSELWVPNAFTPDGNGINDFFLPKGIEIQEFEMYIYDRWGENLFITHDINIGWDGRYKDVICKSDVYYYLIRFTGIGRPGADKRQVRYGPFTLLR
jgi:gliding motility-associated-like protein